MMNEKSNSNDTNLSTLLLESLYIKLLRIRLFEEKAGELLIHKIIHCPTHLYVGQEAIAVGVCQNLTNEDYVFSTHRSHGHYIAKGGSLNELMAELFGKETGCSKGKGGSMHLNAPEVGFMGSSGIVAGSIPMAVGAALSAKMKGNRRVSVAFFGDGAVDEGVCHECLNFASLYRLPVIFVCENNFFSTHLPLFLRQANQELYKKAEVHNIPSMPIDGNNVVEVYITAKEMIERTRAGEGPSFMECRTFRWLAHVGPTRDLDIGYRKKKDVEYWENRCPLKMVERILQERKDWNNGKIENIKHEIEREVEESLRFADESLLPPKRALMQHLFTEEEDR